jgi:hypothetical protein
MAKGEWGDDGDVREKMNMGKRRLCFMEIFSRVIAGIV